MNELSDLSDQIAPSWEELLNASQGQDGFTQGFPPGKDDRTLLGLD
jgi:hypothetical protein